MNKNTKKQTYTYRKHRKISKKHIEKFNNYFSIEEEARAIVKQ